MVVNAQMADVIPSLRSRKVSRPLATFRLSALSEFLGNKILFRQPALEVDDDLPGGLFRICPADTTLGLSPVEMIVPLVPSM